MTPSTRPGRARGAAAEEFANSFILIYTLSNAPLSLGRNPRALGEAFEGIRVFSCLSKSALVTLAHTTPEPASGLVRRVATSRGHPIALTDFLRRALVVRSSNTYATAFMCAADTE